MGLAATLRGFLYICPLPLLARRYTSFHTNVIAHSYCEHMAVVMLSCEDISISNIYGMIIGFVSVMSLATTEARLKAFGTCSSHVCAILAFYIPIVVSSMIHRFGHNVPPPAHTLLANFYLIIPPVLNPIVYAVRTKEIRRRLAKMGVLWQGRCQKPCGLDRMPKPYNECFSPSTFLLTGIPQLEEAHVWLSVPFCFLYLVAVVGNCTILFIVKTEAGLHEPMYLFLCMLAVIDLVLSSSTMPKLLSLFWLGDREIGFHVCLLQMFVIHSFATIESGIFLAMAFDRYVAICAPLRHRTILTHPVVAKMGLAATLRGFLYICPLPLLAGRYTSFHTNVIAHSYCEHMAVVMLSCKDISISNLYGMVIGFLVLIVDSLCIGWSYFLIFRAVMSLATTEARLKAFSTCSSHICAILAFYIPIAVSSLTHRFGHNVPPPAHILLANFYLIIPPVLNPIVYAIRTKEIRRRLAKMGSFGGGGVKNLV
ncbi:UNVERIFIED_CONTAM: hypothetical protein K2H54_073626 [Gekko kuhli]